MNKNHNRPVGRSRLPNNPLREYWRKKNKSKLQGTKEIKNI